MKKLILSFCLVLSLSAAFAADVPIAQAFNTQSNLVFSATTNATGSAVWIEPNLYHTVQISSTLLRTNTVYLDRTLDGSYWTPFYTNTLTVTGAVDTVFIGKWSHIRGRLDSLDGTNCAVTFKYLGGR